MPREGNISGQCDTCHTWGNLWVIHRPVWGTAGELPETAPQVADGCPGCGHRDDPRAETRLVAITDPPASLAGVMPKLAAREVPWLVCARCGHEGPEHWWAWLVCRTPGCGRESRARVHRPDESEEDSGG